MRLKIFVLMIAFEILSFTVSVNNGKVLKLVGSILIYLFSRHFLVSHIVGAICECSLV